MNDQGGYDAPRGERPGTAVADAPPRYERNASQPTSYQTGSYQPQRYQSAAYEQAPQQQPFPYRTAPTPATPVSARPAATAPAQPAAPVRAPAANTAAAAATAGDLTIEVQPGETIFGLAQRHGVSISELMSTNGLKNPNLQPGQKLILPARAAARLAQSRKQAPKAEIAAAPAVAASTSPAATAPSSPASAAPAPESPPISTALTQEAGETQRTYTVKNGDSLYAIAVRNKVPLAHLQKLNGISDPTKVKPGTVLKMPQPAGKAAVAAVTPPVGPKGGPSPAPAAPAVPAAQQADAGQPAAKPVIINSQPAAEPKQVAALTQSNTATDVSGPPAAAVPPAIVSVPPSAAPASDAETSAKAAPDAGGDGQSVSATAAKLRWPVKGRIIAAFGPRPDGQHNDGIKLAVPLGTEVHAAEAGVVAYAGNELKGYGNLILLRHDNGWITAYAHNEELSVKRGDRVRRGQVIAKAGKSGAVDQPQVHFELRQGSSPVDPVPYLEKL